jgi:hypothetical protein
MDLRFIVSDTNPLTLGQLPSGILNYLNDLENLYGLHVFVFPNQD